MASILVIDDDPSIRLLLENYFRARGYDVTGAGDGAHGIGIATKNCPDVVIMDVSMPVLDGPSTLQLMRRIPQISKVPVVVISANKDQQTRIAMEKAGCADFITKPLDMNHLHQAVHDQIKTQAPLL